MILKCLIVDDEPLAHKVIENYISKHNNLELHGNCFNAIDALSYLLENRIDILFLDINMPELSGLDMLRTMTQPPSVILTTAYSEYALESYDLGVVDYLMKPIRFDRFIKAINKVIKVRKPAINAAANSKVVPKKKSIFIKVDGVQHKIILADLTYIESRGNFIQLHVNDKRYLTADTLTKMDKRLQDSGFLRIHKSYIINTNKVKSIQGSMVLVDDKMLPIGNSYKQAVLGKIGM